MKEVIYLCPSPKVCISLVCVYVAVYVFVFIYIYGKFGIKFGKLATLGSLFVLLHFYKQKQFFFALAGLLCWSGMTCLWGGNDCLTRLLTCCVLFCLIF